MKTHSDNEGGLAHLRPLSGRSDRPGDPPPVALDFNHWTSVPPPGPIDMNDVADLVAHVCSPRKVPSHALPRFLDAAAFPDTIQHIVLAVYSGAARCPTPFLGTCSSVPVRFFQTQEYSREGDGGKPKCSNEVLLAASQLLWPLVPSLCIDCDEDFSCDDMSVLKLFSRYRIVFNAHHTDWADELTFISDTSDTPLPSSDDVDFSLALAANCHGGAAAMQPLPGDVCGKFLSRYSSDGGIFVLQQNLDLHLFFASKNEYYILRVVPEFDRESTNEVFEDKSVSLSCMRFRSISVSTKSDVILCLHSLDTKVSKFSSAYPYNKQSDEGVCPGGSCPISDSSPCKDCSDIGLRFLSDKYIACIDEYPESFENAVCSAGAQEMFGFTREAGRGYVSTTSWSLCTSSDNKVEEGEVLEEGEEYENVDRLSHDLLAAFSKMDGGVVKLAICAIDCEMCCTAEGSELTRIAVLCPTRGVVLDTLVSCCIHVILVL